MDAYDGRMGGEHAALRDPTHGDARRDGYDEEEVPEWMHENPSIAFVLGSSHLERPADAAGAQPAAGASSATLDYPPGLAPGSFAPSNGVAPSADLGGYGGAVPPPSSAPMRGSLAPRHPPPALEEDDWAVGHLGSLSEAAHELKRAAREAHAQVRAAAQEQHARTQEELRMHAQHAERGCAQQPSASAPPPPPPAASAAAELGHGQPPPAGVGSGSVGTRRRGPAAPIAQIAVPADEARAPTAPGSAPALHRAASGSGNPRQADGSGGGGGGGGGGGRGGGAEGPGESSVDASEWDGGGAAAGPAGGAHGHSVPVTPIECLDATSRLRATGAADAGRGRGGAHRRGPSDGGADAKRDAGPSGGAVTGRAHDGSGAGAGADGTHRPRRSLAGATSGAQAGADAQRAAGTAHAAIKSAPVSPDHDGLAHADDARWRRGGGGGGASGGGGGASAGGRNGLNKLLRPGSLTSQHVHSRSAIQRRGGRADHGGHPAEHARHAHGGAGGNGGGVPPAPAPAASSSPASPTVIPIDSQPSSKQPSPGRPPSAPGGAGAGAGSGGAGGGTRSSPLSPALDGTAPSPCARSASSGNVSFAEPPALPGSSPTSGPPSNPPSNPPSAPQSRRESTAHGSRRASDAAAKGGGGGSGLVGIGRERQPGRDALAAELSRAQAELRALAHRYETDVRRLSSHCQQLQRACAARAEQLVDSAHALDAAADAGTDGIRAHAAALGEIAEAVAGIAALPTPQLTPADAPDGPPPHPERAEGSGAEASQPNHHRRGRR